VLKFLKSGNLKSQKGYSFLEVMITTSIMAILFSIITFNLLRAQGSSSEQSNLDNLVSDVRAVVVKEKLDKFFIAGHSFGSSIASAYAVKYPDEVKGLVLGDYPPGYPAYPPEWAEKILNDRPEANKTLVQGLQKESKHEMFLEELSKLYIKLLILKGTREDSLLSEKMTGKILAAIPDAELKMIRNCGHELFGENPKESMQVIKDFILKVSSG